MRRPRGCARAEREQGPPPAGCARRKTPPRRTWTACWRCRSTPTSRLHRRRWPRAPRLRRRKPPCAPRPCACVPSSWPPRERCAGGRRPHHRARTRGRRAVAERQQARLAAPPPTDYVLNPTVVLGRGRAPGALVRRRRYRGAHRRGARPLAGRRGGGRPRRRGLRAGPLRHALRSPRPRRACPWPPQADLLAQDRLRLVQEQYKGGGLTDMTTRCSTPRTCLRARGHRPRPPPASRSRARWALLRYVSGDGVPSAP